MPDHPDPTQVERTHRALLEGWRGAMNLVGPGSLDVHFEDSTAVARLVRAQGRWADLGSGAGFPGIALAAHSPGAQVSLVESRSKRAAFLHRVVQQARLANATVFHGRVEELEARSWDGLISRAFAAPEAVLEHARRLLIPGGRLCLMLAREPVEPPADFALEGHHDYRAAGRDRRLTTLSFIG
jgi:16S rRNA (guanine527-N7)-methyltransferase